MPCLVRTSSLHVRFMQVLKDQRSLLEVDLDNLLSSCDFVENILRFGNEAEMMLVKRIMVNRLQSLCDYKPQTEPEENDVLSFQAIDEDLKVSSVLSQLIIQDVRQGFSGFTTIHSFI